MALYPKQLNLVQSTEFCGPVYFVAPPPPRKTRADLIKNINADYYGYRDEDDGILIPMELEKQKKSTSHVNTLARRSLECLFLGKIQFITSPNIYV